MKHVAVVGGGAIGLLCAFYLRRDGADVTVLERDRIGRGSSWGNLGWICPSISTPLPEPGLGPLALASAFRADSPLYLRPAALPRLAPWLIRFWRHCNAEDFARGRAALAALNVRTFDLYEDLVRGGVAFEHARRGLMLVSRIPAKLEADRAELEAVGYPNVAMLSAAELAAAEPGLPVGFAGAVHIRGEWHVRGDTLCRGVAADLLRHGSRVEEGFRVERLVTQAGRIVALEGPAGAVAADAVVIATGAESGILAASLGCRIPMQAGKGYSLSVHEPKTRLECPVYLRDAKVGLTPYEGMLRIGGTMELSGLNRRLDGRRVASIRRVVGAMSPELLEGSRVEEWVGMRPVTPDGLPVIGRLPGTENAFIATGHQMLGMTLAPATGKSLAQLMLEGRSEIDLTPFDAGRFRR